MTESTNLEIYLADPTRTGTLSYDQALIDLDAALAGPLLIDASLYATPYTVPYGTGDLDPKQALRFIKATVSGALSGTWTAYVPPRAHFFVVENATSGGHDIVFKVSGLTGVTVPAGEMRVCYCNGTDVEEIAGASGGGSGTVTSVIAGTGLTGGTITTTGTIALDTPVSVAHGGTGDTTLAAHGVLIGAGTSAVAVTGAGTSGQVLTSNGASADPTFQAAPVVSVNGQTGAVSLVLDSSDFANQGTTTTVLHGNAAGNPSFAAVSLANDVTGNLGVTHLNSGTSASSSTFWRGDGTWGTPSGGGTVTSVATGTGLTGGTITGSGTISLAAIANHDLLANTSGSSAAPIATTLTALIDDAIGATQGDILYRGASTWSVLAPGTAGQVLETNGAAANPTWETLDLGSGSTGGTLGHGKGGTGSTSYTDGQLLIGNTSTTGLSVNTLTQSTGMSITNGHGTITLAVATNGVSNALLAQMATHTIKGNKTGSTANAADLTGTEVTALLDNVVGDTGTGGTKGLVPAPASGDAAAGKFLAADGTWTTPSGAGTVTSVATGTGLTGGTITGSGTISLAAIADADLLANTSGGSAAPVATTLSDLIDYAIAATQGDILYRGASGWAALAPGTSGNVLATQGASANPHWIAAGGTGTVTSVDIASTDLSVSGNPITTSGTITLDIASNAVTNAKLAQMATHRIKGNKTGSTANAADLTGTEVTALLDAVVGDTGTGGTQGLVPAPASGDAAAGKFLKADGTWTTVSGASGGTVTSIATNNGITGGTITATGTIGLAAIADHKLLANTSGGSAAPVETTLSALIDNALGSTQGDILYRGASGWAVLGPGTSGQFLQTQGGSANPQWMSEPFDIACYYGSSVLTSLNIGVRFTASRAISFAANFGSTAGGTSHATCTTTATGSTVFNVDKAASGSENTWTTIGTVTFSAATATATFATTGGATQSLAAGDSLRIISPSTPDATLAGVSITLSGSR